MHKIIANTCGFIIWRPFQVRLTVRELLKYRRRVEVTSIKLFTLETAFQGVGCSPFKVTFDS